MKLKILTFSQPIGDFALGVMLVSDILKIYSVNQRVFNLDTLDTEGGPQRQVSDKRIKEIAEYSETPDATFPTPILLALDEDTYEIKNDVLSFDEASVKASVIDGQHRLRGLEKSKFKDEFSMPVVFVLDATDEQKALIFAIINGKQTRVSASMIYDLFGVVEGRNPYKTAHEIARSLNSSPNSPFYRRLKMLGNKTKGSEESLSQGTFVTQLLRHISSNAADDFISARQGKPMLKRKDSVFNEYFINDKDEVIVRILFNLFSALKEVFPVEWDDTTNFILTKTTGYTGVMKALPEIIKLGREKKRLSSDFFLTVFNNLKTILQNNNLALVSSDFPPNNTGESKLRDYIISACGAANDK